MQQRGEKIPVEVSNFIEQRQEHERLPNISSGGGSRAEAVMQKQNAQCSGTEKELRRLKRKYARDNAAMKALYNSEDSLDYEAKCD